ncbi:MAG: phosphopentomutase [Alphaproteobacteria bacterium]|nr:phosphopentomutase [Alphaproteobacteria bacterium]
MPRVFILVMDSFGIGGAIDAADFGDAGADTFGHIADNYPDLKIPNLVKLGLVKVSNKVSGLNRKLSEEGAKIDFPARYGNCKEISLAKDTSSGHWELAGVAVRSPWGYFKPEYPSFPKELIDKICQRAGLKGILGNKAASGTMIIEELGEEHIKTGMPICYTSVDSCFQIAASEKHFGLERLYEVCQIAFEELKPYNIARVIARPFEGEKKGEFVRTKNRHDYSVKPPKETLLDVVKNGGNEVIAIGKISDIYAGCGVSKKVLASGHEELWDKTLSEGRVAPDNSLIFTNFVDFDMLYGHRRNLEGYAKALEYFDERLPEIVNVMREDDVAFIVADHGNDPTAKGSDHTREQIPVLMFGKKLESGYVGTRDTFADVGQTVAEILGLKIDEGKSFLRD